MENFSFAVILHQHISHHPRLNVPDTKFNERKDVGRSNGLESDKHPCKSCAAKNAL